MGKHDSSKTSAAAIDADSTAANTEIRPRMALAQMEGTPTELGLAAASSAGLRPSSVEIGSIEPARIDLARMDAPELAPQLEEERPAAAENCGDQESGDPAPPPASRAPVGRFAVLAASLALAAGCGAMVGTFGTLSLLRPAPAPVVAGRSGLEEIQALKENVVQTRVELAALKASVETGNRHAGSQLARIAERVDRIERSQAEPAAKLSKAIEALERMMKSDAQGKDITGSIAAAAAAATASAKPAVVDGWVVREVHRGTALLEGRMGLIEVDQGDMVPGLGRVEAIRKQDGRWVVLTSKGLVVPAR
jgi:hypothetical protein